MTTSTPILEYTMVGYTLITMTLAFGLILLTVKLIKELFLNAFYKFILGQMK